MKYYIEEVRKLNGESYFAVKDETGWCYQAFHFKDNEEGLYNYEANLEAAKSLILKLRKGQTETKKIIDF